MTERKKDGNKELRQKAEHLIAQTNAVPEDLTGMSHQQIARLVHELRVHQVELKMQNDELRRIQAELENARDRYVHLYDFAPTAYFTVDEKGNVAEANLTAATLLERQRSTLTGQAFSRFIHREDQDIWYLHRKRLLESGDFQTFQLRMVKSGAYELPVNLECTLVETSDGQQRHIRIAAADITRLKWAEEVLRQSNTTLEQRVAERTKEIRQRNLQLQNLALELSDAEDRERRRLAIVLHDDLQQQLAWLRLKIWDILSEEEMTEHAKANINEIQEVLADSIQRTRQLSMDLSPPVLRQHGLKAALEWLANDMESKQGLSVKLNIQKEVDPESYALASVLFRSVKELLFNVVKHAGVQSAYVDGRKDSNLSVISVMDEGKGFDAAALRTGEKTSEKFGLFSISERIRILGGTLKVDSNPGGGCRVTVSIPVSNTAAEHKSGNEIADDHPI